MAKDKQCGWIRWFFRLVIPFAGLTWSELEFLKIWQAGYLWAGTYSIIVFLSL